MTTGTAPFLREFLRDPVRTASALPSSRSLARAVTAPVPETGDPVVVELGAGTGALTDLIAEKLGGRGHQLAVELNPRLAALLARRHPGLDVAATGAAELPRLLAERGLAGADVVVSGLPWAAYPARGPQLTDVIAGTLHDGGALTQFGYAATRWAPPARRLRQRLGEAFEEVVVGRTISGNLPPAFVLTARRPRRSH
ncbi:SAM-dependent methyltransferase [Pseudonocardia nematodicida]|uniref:SAM-dependent methyltransferase n=1 Tax=Pseudonocardia nematodicida TaxID=1206997 RepID=A0ABV1KEX1_9PSEU